MDKRKNSGPRQQAERLLSLLEEIDRMDLKGLRHAVGLSIEKAARIANVSTRTFGRWENHEAWPNSLEPLKEFCRYVMDAHIPDPRTRLPR